MESTRIVHLVDDDDSYRRALARLLRVSGFDVREHASAESFLEAEVEGQGGCVVTDLRMPGASGLDLQAAIAHSRRPLPVVFLSAHGDAQSIELAKRGGAVDFLTKPVSKEVLFAAIESAFASAAEAARLSPPSAAKRPPVRGE